MNIIFFIKSASIDLNKYTIKDLPGSSGRLDVISRCILAALLNKDNFERKIQIWVFLEKYGTFIFNSERLEYATFPKNELLLADYLVDLIQGSDSPNKLKENPLNSVQILKIDIFEALKQFKELNYVILVLNENGEDFSKYFNEFHLKGDIIFVIGSQSGEFICSKKLLAMDFPNISLGTQSYLASSVIRLIKLYLLKFL
ncbi:MAG: hypothetical protein ACFFAH_12860 [Promethearchaeota archaeon]